MNYLHRRYLPIAAIYLRPKPATRWSWIGSTALSWLIAVTAGIVAILAAAYSQGWIGAL